jgi:hypothetical protein
MNFSTFWCQMVFLKLALEGRILNHILSISESLYVLDNSGVAVHLIYADLQILATVIYVCCKWKRDFSS